MDLHTFARGLPKAELHLHIEGTLEPELLFELAQRNGRDLRFGSVEELREAYAFTDLQSFLDIYYEGAGVLVTVDDFDDLAWAYLQRAHADGVRHAELFFDPQTHTERGVAFETVLDGLCRACDRAAEQLDLSTELICCFLRHLSADEAMATLTQAAAHRDRIVGVGLDSSEKGHPPSKFTAVFDEARRLGFRAVAHAGEEGPPAYITEALDLLKVERIDHGVRAVEDEQVVERLVREGVPLTVCPLSNTALKVFDRMEDHTLRRLHDAGAVVTLNSDDPAYFGGYLVDNLVAAAKALGLSFGDLATMARHSIDASFAADERKEQLRAELEAFLESTRS